MARDNFHERRIMNEPVPGTRGFRNLVLLALAGANTRVEIGMAPAEGDSGLLTAREILGLDLLGTRLVVLSCCESTRPDGRSSRGVIGLQRSFVLAGAQTIVMSLWKVPDQPKQEFLEDFYRRVLAGQPRAEALRDAQLALKMKYPHPLHWGGFICLGNPGTMP